MKKIDKELTIEEVIEILDDLKVDKQDSDFIGSFVLPNKLHTGKDQSLEMTFSSSIQMIEEMI